jgi:hypothetical protein
MHGRRRPCYEPLAAAWRWWSCPDDAHNRKLGRGGDAGNISVSAASDRRYPLLQMCQPRDNSALETVDPPAVSLGEPPPASDLAPTPARPQSRLAAGLLLLEARILLALAQVFYAGYGLGVGNQTIQIPFLHHHINPDLYAKDPAIQTARDYPSFFFHGLAWLARRIEIPRLYLSLHLLTTLAVLAAGYALARTISGLHAAGIVMVLLLLGGHHRALAGDEMYSLGFTHTWAVFPLAIVAILLLYRGWTMAAFALAGAIFNLHALTAAYLGAMFGFWAACQALRREGIALWRQSRPHLDADPSTAPLSQDGRLSVPDDAEPAVSSSGRGARAGQGRVPVGRPDGRFPDPRVADNVVHGEPFAGVQRRVGALDHAALARSFLPDKLVAGGQLRAAAIRADLRPGGRGPWVSHGASAEAQGHTAGGGGGDSLCDRIRIQRNPARCAGDPGAALPQLAAADGDCAGPHCHGHCARLARAVDLARMGFTGRARWSSPRLAPRWRRWRSRRWWRICRTRWRCCWSRHWSTGGSPGHGRLWRNGASVDGGGVAPDRVRRPGTGNPDG